MNPHSRPAYPIDASSTYRILIYGTLDADWTDRVGGLIVSANPLADGTPATLLVGELADQSALVGVLNTLHDLGLSLISLERVSDDPSLQEVMHVRT